MLMAHCRRTMLSEPLSYSVLFLQPSHVFLLVRLRFCYGRLMSVKPLTNIPDGILVERLVKTIRYVGDMRRCQYVVQSPERVIRRQRLNVEYVDRRTGDWLVLQHADQSLPG